MKELRTVARYWSYGIAVQCLGLRGTPCRWGYGAAMRHLGLKRSDAQKLIRSNAQMLKSSNAFSLSTFDKNPGYRLNPWAERKSQMRSM